MLLMLCALAVASFAQEQKAIQDLTPQEQVAKLDAVISKAKSLKEFLDSPALQQEYFLALQELNGGPERFPEKSYKAILAQVRDMVTKVPGLETRLWETTGLGQSFSVKAESISAGRDLNIPAFEAWYADWQKGLSEMKLPEVDEVISASARESEVFSNAIERFKKNPGNAEWKDDFRIFDTAAVIRDELKRQEKNPKKAQELALFDKILAGEAGFKDLDKKQLDRFVTRVKDRFITAQENNPKLKEAFSGLARTYASGEAFRDAVNSNNSDNVFDIFDKLRDRRALDPDLKADNALGDADKRALDSILSRIDKRPRPFGWDSLWKAIVPDSAKLKTNVEVFPKMRDSRGKVIEGATGEVLSFIPAPRRIHGIWGGIALRECTGGSCTALNSISPERWGLVALKDSQYHFTFSGNKNDGFVSAVPLDLFANGKATRVASINLASPMLKRAVRTAKGDRPLETRSIFEVVYPEFIKRKPRDWRGGFVLANTSGSDNANVLETVTRSNNYGFGKKVGESKNLVHIDPLAAKIIVASPKNGYASAYSGRMMSEATLPGAKNLTRLTAYDANFLKKLILNKGKFEAFLKSRPDLDGGEILKIFLENKIPLSNSNVDFLFEKSSEIGRFLPPGVLSKESKLYLGELSKKLVEKSLLPETSSDRKIEIQDFVYRNASTATRDDFFKGLLRDERLPVATRLNASQRLVNISDEEKDLLYSLLKKGIEQGLLPEVARLISYKTDLVREKRFFDLIIRAILASRESSYRMAMGLLKDACLNAGHLYFVGNLHSSLLEIPPIQRQEFLTKLNVYSTFFLENAALTRRLRSAYLREPDLIEISPQIFEEPDVADIAKKVIGALQSKNPELQIRASRIFESNWNYNTEEIKSQNSVSKLFRAALKTNLKSKNADVAIAAAKTVYFRHSKEALSELLKHSRPEVRIFAISRIEYATYRIKELQKLMVDSDPKVAAHAVDKWLDSALYWEDSASLNEALKALKDKKTSAAFSEFLAAKPYDNSHSGKDWRQAYNWKISQSSDTTKLANKLLESGRLEGDAREFVIKVKMRSESNLKYSGLPVPNCKAPEGAGVLSRLSSLLSSMHRNK